MELLPCPFCGGKATSHTTRLEWCFCNRCFPTGNYISAVNWNARNAPTDQRQAFSRFQSSLDHEHTKRVKAEMQVKILEEMTEVFTAHMRYLGILPAQMSDAWEKYKKDKSI